MHSPLWTDLFRQIDDYDPTGHPDRLRNTKTSSHHDTDKVNPLYA